MIVEKEKTNMKKENGIVDDDEIIACALVFIESKFHYYPLYQ